MSATPTSELSSFLCCHCCYGVLRGRKPACGSSVVTGDGVDVWCGLPPAALPEHGAMCSLAHRDLQPGRINTTTSNTTAAAGCYSASRGCFALTGSDPTPEAAAWDWMRAVCASLCASGCTAAQPGALLLQPGGIVLQHAVLGKALGNHTQGLGAVAVVKPPLACPCLWFIQCCRVVGVAWWIEAILPLVAVGKHHRCPAAHQPCGYFAMLREPGCVS